MIKVNWYLLSNGNIEESKKNIEIKYENNILYYQNGKYLNTIDVINKIFKRKSPDYELLIDFEKKEITFDFKEKGKYSMKLKTYYYIDKKYIKMKYILDCEEKEIIVEKIN